MDNAVVLARRGEIRSPENSLLCVFGQANPAPTVDDGIGLLVSTYPHGGESLYSVAALCFLRHASDLSGGVFPLFCR